jgi:hypothetical protein
VGANSARFLFLLKSTNAQSKKIDLYFPFEKTLPTLRLCGKYFAYE